MIKFFRRIRKTLFSENTPGGPSGKFGKYLLYAIGEIALVMIGILLALQVNNWNEQRKADKAESKALVALKNEFELNIERLEFICAERDSAQEDRRAHYDIIANDTIPIETKVRSNVKGYFGGRWAIQNTVLNGLVNSGAIDNIKNDSLKTLLTLWPNMVQRWIAAEDKYNSLKERMQDYERTRLRQGIPNRLNDKRGYTFKDSWEQYYSRKAFIVNDLEYQNFVASDIEMLYQQSIICNRIMQNYNQIITALNSEIQNRKIK
ncbi:DUF6090 family protein [Fulvivirga sedimenti]|uniref:Uncharacterized protein n=1 Tax=Fulvivirga sedimenti TaxID=2879465 RepID=A0A9X1HN05_9BACT|nr:DUF6090 family protein [Fulvivirga sedimenti]MCA6073808.1 hypothetical protein [Fulvivirga sedimenti]